MVSAVEGEGLGGEDEGNAEASAAASLGGGRVDV